MRWTTEVEGAEWVAERLATFAFDVTSVVPEGYAAYARIFHPIGGGVGSRWSTMAVANGRIPHPEMQYPWISHPVGEPFDLDDEDGDPSEGSLPFEEGRRLGELLEPHTTTPGDLWFALWEGWGHVEPGGMSRLTADGRGIPSPGILPQEIGREHRLRVPNRDYYLLRGALGELRELYELLGRHSPNLWWPADRAWCVATEIDFCSTYVGGSEAAIEAILQAPDLEALPAKPTDGVSYDADVLNRALDGR
jgi:hypothetical protein